MRKSDLPSERKRHGRRTARIAGALFLSLCLTCPAAQAQNSSFWPQLRFRQNSAPQAEAEPPVIISKPMTISEGRDGSSRRVAKVASVAPPTEGQTAAPVSLPDEDDLFVTRSISTEPAAETPAVPAENAAPPSAETVTAEPAAETRAASSAEDASAADAPRYTTEGETLEDAWNAALSVSRALSAKDYERLGAEATVAAAQGVGLPKLSNVTGAHAISEELAIKTDAPLSQLLPILPDVTLESPLADKQFLTTTTALTVPIYMGGRVQSMIEAAEAASCAIGAGRQIQEKDLKYEVAETYFLVLRVRHLYEVAEEAEKTIAEHEKDAQRLLDNGIVTKNVILAAQVAHANARQDLIKAQNAVNLSQAAYNRLLWRPLDTPVNIADVDIPPLSGELESLTSAAVNRRPELSALSYKSRALSAKSRVYQADRLPQVAAIGSYDYVENSHLNENSFFTGSLGVAWTPFDGGVSRNRQSAAEYEAMAVTREYEEAESKIRLQVYKCWQDEQETRERVRAAEKAVESAEENLRVVNRGFKEGLTNHTEVLDAQTMLTHARSNLANACYDAVLATYHLQRATGDL
ncbi:MAG: TolC family protein [Thermoguttaceae bacterium]|nr:TolC family protein [Thermoguttaceae bacterium]